MSSDVSAVPEEHADAADTAEERRIRGPSPCETAGSVPDDVGDGERAEGRGRGGGGVSLVEEMRGRVIWTLQAG